MAASIYLKQMELGPMANYVYFVGDPQTREVAVIDPAWAVDRIVEMAQESDLTITKILITHSHFDHINGVEDLLHRTGAKVYIHKAEAEFMKAVWPELVLVESGATTPFSLRRACHVMAHAPVLSFRSSYA